MFHISSQSQRAWEVTLFRSSSPPARASTHMLDGQSYGIHVAIPPIPRWKHRIPQCPFWEPLHHASCSKPWKETSTGCGDTSLRIHSFPFGHQCWCNKGAIRLTIITTDGCCPFYPSASAGISEHRYLQATGTRYHPPPAAGVHPCGSYRAVPVSPESHEQPHPSSRYIPTTSTSNIPF
jgi:hypothetical protein